jgi:hypothetical protein
MKHSVSLTNTSLWDNVQKLHVLLPAERGGRKISGEEDHRGEISIFRRPLRRRGWHEINGRGVKACIIG